MNLWKIATVVWFGIEVVLSHTPGDQSGAKSQAISRLTGIDEGLLRRSAHVSLFAVLSLLAGVGWGWIGVVVSAVWSVLDEMTKRWIPGRHSSAFDMLLNLFGVVIGTAVWLIAGGG